MRRQRPGGDPGRRAGRGRRRIGLRDRAAEPPTAAVALALGGNLGDRRRALTEGVRLLAPFLREIRVAALWETEPVSDVHQGPFLNSALTGLTRLSPEDLLAVAKAVERLAGRRRGERWGPRPLDVDLLLHGDRVRDDPELTLPHPRLAERSFYLIPLAEIAAGWRVPPSGVTVGELLRRLPKTAAPRRLDWAPLG